MPPVSPLDRMRLKLERARAALGDQVARQRAEHWLASTAGDVSRSRDSLAAAVVVAAEAGVSQRRIARVSGLARNTVAAIIAAAETGGSE